MLATFRRFLLPLGAASALALCAIPIAHADKDGTLSGLRGSAPVVRIINGDPLTVHVGDEHSYQIFNADIPGVGQIYPSGSTGTADMGWMVRAGGVLYGPDYSSHSSGSATGSLGSVTAFSGRTISAVTGTGSAADPFQVTISNQLGASGLVSQEVVRYVNGDNYFSKRFTLTNNGAATQDVRVFLGGDIYLAGSDSGIPFLQGSSGAVGGSDCGTPASYYILYIPQTPADRYTGSGYSSVWSQIGAGELSDSLSTTNCIDNGAALQWNRSLAQGASVTILATTSFGDIPDIAQFDITNVTPASGNRGATVNVTITGLGFAPGMQVSFGSGITVSNLVVVNANSATATLTIAAAAALGLRDVVGISANGNLTATLVGGFEVLGGDGPPPPPPPPPTPAQPVPGLGTVGLAVLLLGMLAVAGFARRRRYG